MDMLSELQKTFETIVSEIDAGPIVPDVTSEQIRAHLARYSFTEPVPLDDVAGDVKRMMHKWNVQVTHSRYLGLFNPSVTFPSVLGDTLAAIYNPQLATWRTSPAANEMERHVLSWLSKQFGLPDESAAFFTSGGSEANLSAMVVALFHTFPTVRENGLRGLPGQPTVYATGHAHHGLSKSVCITGLGQSALRVVAADRSYRMDVSDLAKRVEEDRRQGLFPFMVIATAGTTGAGVIDPLPEVVNYCRSQDLWCHIDAAWGGAAIISPDLKQYLEGIQGADSITCDAHKGFSVPMGAGMFFCRHADAVHGAFSSAVSFMPPSTNGGASDPYTTSPQWSRRFTGLKLFISLACLGKSGYAELIQRQARLGVLMREGLRATGWQIVNSTPLPVVCFTRDGVDAARFVPEVQRRQIAWISQVTLDGRAPVLRACITSIRTTENQVRSIIEQMNSVFSDHLNVPNVVGQNAA